MYQIKQEECFVFVFIFMAGVTLLGCKMYIHKIFSNRCKNLSYMNLMPIFMKKHNENFYFCLPSHNIKQHKLNILYFDLHFVQV